MQPLVYTPGDNHSLGVDYITVDGKRVDYVVMACPRRGVVDAYQKMPGEPTQVKLDKRRKRVLTKRYRGAVRVIFLDGTVDAGGDCG